MGIRKDPEVPSIKRLPGQGFTLQTRERQVRVELVAVTGHKADLKIEAFTVIPRVAKRDRPVIVALGPSLPVTVSFEGRDGDGALLKVNIPVNVQLLRDESMKEPAPREARMGPKPESFGGGVWKRL